MKLIHTKLYAVLLLFLIACSGEKQVTGQLNETPVLVPDYTDVTIPPNIAPLNFSAKATGQHLVARFSGTGNYAFDVETTNGSFTIPAKQWKALLAANRGKQITITLLKEDQGQWKSCNPIHITVAEEPVDSYLAYRLIEPGYALWNEMGIWQRNLESYEETAVFENKMTNYNCVNCHSFCMQNPDKMLFLMRSSLAGAVLVDGDRIDFVNTQTDKTIPPLAYPSWHPSGRFIACSVNKTTQGLHATQRVEVYDTASDVVVYDVEKKAILSASQLFAKDVFETFPTFSPDGKTLYYCSAPACEMPDSINQLRYSLCAISFDPETGTFGSRTDTLYNARLEGRSVSFPRVSPDGNFLLCTLSGYGTFPIWHKDADLYQVNLETGEGDNLSTVNSDDTESYHSWSSNSRWMVFSSRRMDGLYTRPFLVYIRKDGQAAKPFVLPQKDTDHYTFLTKSYNIPEFITGKIKDNSYRIMQQSQKSSP